MEVVITEETNKKHIEEFIRNNEYILNQFYLSRITANEIFINEIENIIDNDESLVKKVYVGKELVCIYILKKLDWDEEVFGRNMWRMNIIANTKLHIKVIKSIKADLKTESRIRNIEHVSSSAKTKDYKTTYALEACGFRLVDSIVRFGYDLENYKKNNQNFDKFNVRRYHELDYNKLIKLGTDVFSNYPNRFLNDGTFEKEKCDQMYIEWLKNSIKGYSDILLVAEKDNKILGFSTIKNKRIVKERDIFIAERQISGVSGKSRGLGLNTKMLEKQLELVSNYACFFEVGTQVYNYASQKTYYKCGLKPFDSYYSFHFSF